MSFVQPTSRSGLLAVREKLLALSDGTSLRCIGRDRTSDPWDSGLCMKQGEQLHFQYSSGDIEVLPISWINFRTLVHVDFGDAEESGRASGGAAAGAWASLGSPSPSEQGRGREGDAVDAHFQQTPSVEEVAALRAHLLGLPNASCFQCRGRDRVDEAWSYGLCVKHGKRLLFSYDDGGREDFGIEKVNFKDLVQLQTRPPAVPGGTGVAVIAHGFCPESGPDYQLVIALARAARDRGWLVVVPDFRPSYELETRAGRAARVSILADAILEHSAGVDFIALAGHSQGGRASANVCFEQRVAALPIRGCLMFGSEDPAELGSRPPPVPHVRIAHAAGDGVISAEALRCRAQLWGVPFAELRSRTAPERGRKDAFGDDINHDFLTDLLPKAVWLFSDFLDACGCPSGA